MSEIKKKQYEDDPALRERVRAGASGKKQSAETVAKRVKVLTGQKRTAEQRARMSAAALTNRENRRKAALARWHPSQEGG